MRFAILQRTTFALALCAVFGLPRAGFAGGEKVRISYSLEFESEVMVNEVKVALTFILSKVLKEQGLDAEFLFFAKEEENRAAAAEGKVDMFDMSAINYALLPEAEREGMRPFIVPQYGEGELSRFVLLAPEGTELDDLRGKRLRRITKRDRTVASSWLESELWRAQGVRLEEFFGEVTDCEVASEVVVPTFFGKADCCLVEIHEYELLAELNPQISKKLRPLKTSPELLSTLFLLRKDFDAVEEGRAIRIAESLHLGKEGGQAFMLMRIKRLRKFREDDLKGIFEVAEVMREIGAAEPGNVEFATKEDRG